MAYKDVDPKRWSAGSIAVVTRAGLMGGYPDGTFQPGKPVTREEMASILARQLFRDGLFSDILPTVLPSVVLVHRGDALGSGACVANKGGQSYIITNAHVAGDSQTFSLIKEGRDNVDALLVAKDTTLDLAILRTTAKLPPLKISTELELGQPVAVVGAPAGFAESVTVGVVSHLDRGPTWYQLDAPINPGNSGGPVINEKGQIVGVAVAKLVDVAIEGMGFAIKPHVVEEYIAKVLG